MDNSRKRKRPDTITSAAPSADITTAKQLESLLGDLSSQEGLEKGAHQFYLFLIQCSRIHNCSEETLQQNLKILKQWLETQSKNTGDSEEEEGQVNAFRSILQVCSFAAQKPYHTVMMSVMSSLTSLVRTCSQNDELKTYGTVLCKAILQPTYLKIVYQNLRSNHDRISTPTLKLLTEINKFDFGSICGLLHSAFDFTIKDITKNFGIRGGKEVMVATEETKKPSVRTSFVRFLLSFFQHGSASVKNEVLQQRVWITTLFKNLKYDAPFVVHEVLEAVGKRILEDRGIPRATKTSIFHEGTLASILALYDRTDVVNLERAGKTEEKAVKEISHEFLMKTCTTPGNGVCFSDSGWYPLKRGENGGERAGPLSVHNRTLASFITKVRPYFDILQQDLLLGIFKACPELVASYFQSNPPFSFDPKLTSTWIGYCAFLTSTIQLPTPKNFGMGELSAVPPPVNIVIESVVPKPLNKATLTKCLQENSLIKFFVTRLLIFSFQKLRAVLGAIDDASKSMVDPSSNWVRVRSELIEEFCKRVPDMSFLVGLVHSSFKGKNQIQGKLQKEASSRLLADYFELLPEVATSGNFDISTALGNFFANKDNVEDRGFRVLEMGHLLRVAEDSPDIKWWNKGSMQFSPFVSILNICCGPASKMPLKQIRKLLRSFITPSSLFQSETIATPLETLLESLSCIQDPLALTSVLLFIDQCAIRCIRTPFKYTDDYAELALETMRSKPLTEKFPAVSPLTMTLVEQWKFFMKSDSITAVKDTASIWLVRFLESSVILGENKYVLAVLCGRLATICEETGHLDVKVVFTALKLQLENEKDLELERGSSNHIAPHSLNSLSTRRLFRDLCHFNIANVERVTKSIEEREIDVSLLDVAVTQKAIIYVLRSQRISSDDACSALSKLMDLMEAIVVCLKERDDTGIWNDAKSMLATNEDWVKLFLGLPAELNKTSTKLRDFTRYAYFSERYSSLLGASFDSYEPILNAICVQAQSSIESLGRYLEDNPDDHFTEILSTYKCIITQLFSYEHMLDFIKTFILIENEPTELKFEILALLLQQLSSRGQYLPLKDLETLLATGDAPKTFYNALTGYILSVPKEEIEDLDIEHYHMNFEAELHEWMVSLDCALIRQVKSVRETAISTLDTNLSNGKNIPHLERHFSTFLASFAVPRGDAAGFEWEKSAGSEVKKKMERFFSVIQDKMFENPPDAPQIETFLMGASLLNSLDNNRLLKFITTDNRRSTLTANTTALLNVLIRDMSSGETESIELRNWLLMVLDHLTRRFAEEKTLSDKILDFTKQLGRLLNLGAINLNSFVPRPTLNAVLEVSLEKHIHIPEVVYFAAVIVSQLPANTLEVAKLLQIILGHAQNPLILRDSYFDTQEISYHTAFLIYRLFSMASSRQSNITTLDGVLSLYRGSNDIIDAALYMIISDIEAHLARSIGDRIASWTVVENSDIPLVSRVRGRLIVTVDSKTLARSVFQSSPNRPIIPKEKLEQLESFIAISKNEDQHFSKTYDLGFILPALTFCLHSEQQVIEITTVIERHCLGFAITGLCSDRSHVRDMAIGFIVTSISKLEKSSHREKHQLLELLCTLVASISDMAKRDGEQSLKRPIPTVLGVFFAQCVQIVVNPGHFLYEKIMTSLLQQGPIMDLYDLPYILQVASPERGDDYYKEISWVLGVLVAGLKTTQDLAIYHKRKIFGGCLNAYIAPHCSDRAKERILELLWNTAAVEGGATTLITRNAIMSFIETQACSAEKDDLVLFKRLSARLYEASSKGHVKEWAKGNLEAHLEDIFVI